MMSREELGKLFDWTQLDFNERNIYYYGIVIMAMLARIREKQYIKVSDHKFFTVSSGKQTYVSSNYPAWGV